MYGDEERRKIDGKTIKGGRINWGEGGSGVAGVRWGRYRKRGDGEIMTSEERMGEKGEKGEVKRVENWEKREMMVWY